jgi:hypothetical protein
MSEAFRGIASHRGALFGRELRTSLVYGDTFSMTNSSGYASVQHFSVNGLHDIDTTNVGHQCRGYDQIMTLYDHYEVLGFKITVQACIPEAATNSHCVGLLLYDGAGSSSTVIDQLEQRQSKTLLISPGKPGTISLTCNPHKFLGRPVGQSSMIGQNGSQPGDMVYCRLFCFAPDGSSTVTVSAVVTIEYRVRFIEPQRPPAS